MGHVSVQWGKCQTGLHRDKPGFLSSFNDSNNEKVVLKHPPALQGQDMQFCAQHNMVAWRK
jgi:hypothetical protein